MIDGILRFFGFTPETYKKVLLSKVPKAVKPRKKRRKKWNAEARAAASLRMKALYKPQRSRRGWTPEARQRMSDKMKLRHAERRIIGRVDAGIPSLGVSTNPMGH